MKVPLSWLRSYVDVELPVPELSHRLTMAGLEVEDVQVIGAGWLGVTIARVASLERHPAADSLFVAQLDLGSREATVVTAATNLTLGALVPHVAAGGRLGSTEVGTRAFHGVVSEGMVCSGDELGLTPDRDGIYLLEAEAPVGEDLAAYLDEVVLDIYITPNRPDCMSMVGIAREIHALTGADWHPPAIAVPRGATRASQLAGVRIEDPVGCPRFTVSAVQGVRIAPSPPWLQRRLALSGVRPISNVVDVTNYVMLELGQPLHAFDRQRLAESTLVARRARPGERLTTLDGVERALADSMLVVADPERARSVAGIMGGADSEIGDSTTDVLLEGASWDRASIRLASAALNLSSEASRRFGRGVDPDLTAPAVSRAAQLIAELAGGAPADGLVDAYPGQAPPRVLTLTPAQVEDLLGVPYPAAEIEGTLERLGFDVEAAGPDECLSVTVPGHRRFDVEQRADLVEEVARVGGYDRIPAHQLAGAVPAPRADGDGGYADELRARRSLAALGLQEVITYSLVSPDEPARLSPTGQAVEELIRVANPLSADQSALRASLVGSLLPVGRTTLRLSERVAIFELARTWRAPLAPLPAERRTVAMLLAGPRAPRHWSGAADLMDFYDLKGVVEAFLAGLDAEVTILASPGAPAHLHPGRAAILQSGARVLGSLGQLHPTVAERFDFGAGIPVLVAEIDVEDLLGTRAAVRSIAAPSRFPPADRDISLILDDRVPEGEVAAVIRRAGGALLTAALLVDVYRGAPVPPGRKSLTYTLRYQAADRTLEDAEVATAHLGVEQALRDQVEAEIRGR